MSVLSSCAVLDWFGAKVDDEEVDELAKSVKDPIDRKTPYDNALKEFGRMLEAYNISPIRVQSKIISNLTADQSLPTNVSRMLITGVNKIGPEVVYIPYDPQYYVGESTTGGNIQRTLPQIVIAGGITEYAKELIEKQRELKMDAKIQKGDFGSNYDYDGGVGYKAGESISRIAFDMHLLAYTTQASITGTNVSNSVYLRKTELGWGVGAFFQGIGLTFDYNLRKKQNIYYAIRLLVELSVLESLGKYFDVPYWRVLDGAKSDQAMIFRLKEEFADLPVSEQILYIKEYLFFHGVENVNRGSSELTSGERSAINSKMQQYGVSDYTDLFLQLWENVPIKESRRRNRAYNRNLERQQNTVANQQQQQPAQPEQVQSQPVQQVQAQQQAPSQPELNQALQEEPVNNTVVDQPTGQTPAQETAPAAKPVSRIQSQPTGTTQRSETKSDKEAPVGFGETEW